MYLPLGGFETDIIKMLAVALMAQSNHMMVHVYVDETSGQITVLASVED